MYYGNKPKASDKFFPVPNVIFNLGLDGGEILVYLYLMYCEDRKTFQCYPGYKTIGSAVGMSVNTVRKYVQSLEKKRLITTEWTMVRTKSGKAHNGTLKYTIRPIQEAIDSNEFVKAFIDANNIHTYDVATIIKERYWLDPFDISPVFEEELSFSIQLLRYAVDNFDGDFTRLYGTHHYTSSKSTANDEMRKFIEHVIDPLIDYICEYIRKCYERALEKEGKNNPFTGTSINATNSMVLVGSSVAGNATNEVVITETVKNDAQDLLFAIKEAMRALDIPTRSEIEELIEQIESEIQSSKKPKKGVLTALKVLCSGVTTILPLVKALVELF